MAEVERDRGTEPQWSAKQAGVVYTPDHIVDFMLSDLLPSDLAGLRICEPACGDGVFLAACVRRICEQFKVAKEEKQRQGYLATLRQLTGFDIDERAVAECKVRLTETLEDVLDDSSVGVDWRIEKVDLLDRSSWANYRGSFDFIVGNPPYVRVQHLEQQRRAWITAEHWRFMSGCADLYFLFFEAGMELLRRDGELSFITPNSWLKSAAGRALRENLAGRNRVQRVVDFDDHQVFPSVTTYTAITRVKRGGNCKTIAAAKATVESGAVVTDSDYTIDASVPMWTVASRKERQTLRRRAKNGVRLGDIATIKVGVQTLADRVFILQVLGEDEAGICCTDGTRKILLEKEGVRRINKASVMTGGVDPVERVAIYPYDSDGQLIPFATLRDQFPLAATWLTKNKEILLSRDKGRIDKTKWHGYGRHVGITSAFGVKILTAGMNKSPNFMLCEDEDRLFYSGYGIKPLFGISIEALLVALNSREMNEFIKTTSKPYQGGWRSYAKTFIQHFPVDKKLLYDV